MHGGDAGEPFHGAVQGGDTPFRHLVHEDIERRLVELDHVDAVGGERARLLVQQAGERHRKLDLVAVMAVGDRIKNGHRTRQREFQPAFGVGAGEPGLGRMHATFELHRSYHGRYHGFVAVLTDAHFDPPSEVDAVDLFEKSVDEMLTRLLAVGHDVDARVLLLFQHEQSGIALGGRKLGT